MRRSLRSLSPTVAVVGVVLWILAPLIGVYLIQRSLQQASFVTPQQVWAPALAQQEVTPEAVAVALGWSPAAQLHSPVTWTSNLTIGAVTVATNDVLQTGDPVLVADGITRLAVFSPQPFYRPLGLGAEGSDVRWLNAALTRLGMPHGTGSTLSEKTLSGIQRLSEDLGVPAEQRTLFDPGWFIYLPTEELTVDSINVTTAGPAPSAGAPILSGRPTLSSATIVAATYAPTPANPGEADPGLPPAVSEVPDSSRISVRSDQKVLLNGVEMPLTDDRAHIDVGAAPALQDAALTASRDAPSLPAQVLTVTSARGLRVPASAVYNSSLGKMCVIARSKTRAASSIAVLVSSSANGQAIIEGIGAGGLQDSPQDGLQVGDEVLLSPAVPREPC